MAVEAGQDARGPRRDHVDRARDRRLAREVMSLHFETARDVMLELMKITIGQRQRYGRMAQAVEERPVGGDVVVEQRGDGRAVGTNARARGEQIDEPP